MPTPTSWSLEISSSAVKLLGLVRRKKTEFEIVHASRQLYDSMGALAETVKQVIAAGSPQTSLMATSVWASTMVIRKISLAKLKPGEIRGALQLEADKYVPFGLDECILDYFPFPDDPRGLKSDVMLIAAKKDLILDRCKLLEASGLKLKFMDIHPLALTNWLLIKRPQTHTGITALIHIGDVPGKIAGEDNFLVILKEGVPWVIRDLGDRLAAPELTDEALTQTAALAANAIVFFENMTHEKPSEILISAGDTIASRLAEALEKASRIKPVRWAADEGLVFSDEAAQKSFGTAPGTFASALGACARGSGA
jgi:hypothetical protein